MPYLPESPYPEAHSANAARVPVVHPEPVIFTPLDLDEPAQPAWNLPDRHDWLGLLLVMAFIIVALAVAQVTR